MNCALQMDKVSFSYRDESAVSLASLSINEGETVAIIGPNGAGKSTMLSLACGRLRSDAGDVKVFKKSVLSMKTAERASRISILTQFPVVPRGFNCLETVIMGRSAYASAWGFDSADDIAIASDALDVTGCSKFKYKNVDALSGGEVQRVMIARALAQRPSILLLDEPTSHLDIGHALNIARMLANINRIEGTTILCAMHDINLAISMCDRVIFMRDGWVIGDTSSRDVDGDILFATFGVRMNMAGKNACDKPYFIPIADSQ